jgi:cytochrome P450/NADPH-cytochrome P450 reductase
MSVTVQRSKIAQSLGCDKVKYRTIIANRKPVGTEVGPTKGHIYIRLPEGSQYTAGDYLVVLPRNPPRTVRGILAGFGLVDNYILSIEVSKKNFLPTDPMFVKNFLSTVVELRTLITKTTCRNTL